MRRPPRPTSVRAAAIVLALLAHACVLLLFSFGGRTPAREQATLQFVSIWPADQPVPPAAAPPTPPPPRQLRNRVPAPPDPPSVTAPIAPSESEAPQQETPRYSIDWHGEAAHAAARSAAKGDQPETFSPPPKVLRQACKPKKSSFEWNPEEKKYGLLPVPYVRLGSCVVGLGLFACSLNGPPPANGHLFDDLKKGDRPVSSVADPNTCD